MILEKIELSSFRNIDNCVLKPSCGLTVICGNNGQGKTNLLESIWLLTGSKSFRTSKDIEIVNKNKEFSKISAFLNNSCIEQKKIEISIKKDTTNKRAIRSAKVNDIDYGRASNIAGIFNCVVFSPEHLALVKGQPEGRRKFIDACLCQLYPSFLDIYKRYVRLLSQKNAFLKDIKKGTFLEKENVLLDVLDNQLAEYGSQIVKTRKIFVDSIYPIAFENYKNISGGKENLYVLYEESCIDSHDKDCLYNAFLNVRKIDKKTGFCTVGPHRDDFRIMLNGEDSRIFASQGQQRSAVLALKISEAEQIEKITEKKPVLLLDDVLSELDNERQDFLLNKIEDKQVFVTSCEYNLFKKTNGLVFQMKNGNGAVL